MHNLLSSRARVQVQTATRKQTRIKHVLVSVASSLTFWGKYIAAGSFPRGEPTESARLVLLGLPSFSVADHFSFYPTSYLVLAFLSFSSFTSFVLLSPFSSM
jgi:hypothetical protein